MRFLFFLLICIMTGRLCAEHGALKGKVVDETTGAPIHDALVEIQGTDIAARTDSLGTFIISFLEAGTCSVRVFADNYHTVIMTDIRIMNQSITNVHVYMIHYRTGKLPVPDESNDHSVSRTHKYMKPMSEGEGAPRHESLPPGNKPYSFEIEYAPESLPEEAVTAAGSHRDVIFGRHSFLSAGYADDNRQFNYYLNFLEMYGDSVDAFDADIRERYHISVCDVVGKSLPNADFRILAGERQLNSGKTFTDGSLYVYPALYGAPASDLKVEVTAQGMTRSAMIRRNGPASLEIRFDTRRQLTALRLDLLFLLDTSGSMGEEIERLKQTIDIINMNISALDVPVQIRYGMVLYRDREDEYCTRVIPFTAHLPGFQDALNQVNAEGGGDDPEDLQQALYDALHRLEWSEDGVRLGFILTDAPPHLDYGQKFTYLDAALEAGNRGIKLFTIGTGGLDLQGEYILRQIAQLTSAKYIFLTYGEKGESDGGKPGSVSHHTGSNFNAERLEAVIIRMAKEELRHLTDLPLEPSEEYIQAIKVADESREMTVRKIFSAGIRQLLDYSIVNILDGTTVSVMPLVGKTQGLQNAAEYFSEQLNHMLVQNGTLKAVIRSDLQFILEEVGIQLSGLTEAGNAIKIGTFLRADLILTGNLFFQDYEYIIFLKLYRVETAELLSTTKLKIDFRLGV